MLRNIIQSMFACCVLLALACNASTVAMPRLDQSLPKANGPDRAAQPAPPAELSAEQQTALREAFMDLDRGRYLRAIDRLHTSAGSPPKRQLPTFSLWWQMHPTITTVPDMSYADGGEPRISPETERQIHNARLEDAVAAIVRRARHTRIVILNEAHHSPRDRAFALRVARALRPLGYTYLAAEAFSTDQRQGSTEPATLTMARDGYPRISQGMYLKDPVFGDFVRQSLRLGYRPVAYEQVRTATSDNSMSGREQAQAENLMDAIFRRDPEARVFIYVGYDHAAERPIAERGVEWMAARLKKMTGIDPLTIDQTFISEYAEDPTSRGVHAMATRRRVQSSAVLISGSSPLVLGRYEGAIDLQVVHPRTLLRQGRPTWLFAMGRRAVAIPRHLLPRTGRRLIQAFEASEAEDAVPVDQVVVEAGHPVPVLMLPPRPIRFEVQEPT